MDDALDGARLVGVFDIVTDCNWEQTRPIGKGGMRSVDMTECVDHRNSQVGNTVLESDAVGKMLDTVEKKPPRSQRLRDFQERV